MRHTYATLALNAGADPAWIAGQMGNSLPVLLRHYARYLVSGDERNIAALNRIGSSGSGNKVATRAEEAISQ